MLNPFSCLVHFLLISYSVHLFLIHVLFISYSNLIYALFISYQFPIQFLFISYSCLIYIFPMHFLFISYSFYTDGRIVRTQRFFETKVRTHSKLEPTNFKIGSKFHFFLHKWLKTKKSLSRPCSRVSGKLCTKCCISYIKRTLDSRTHEVSKGKKCNFTCINDWKWRSLSVNPSHGPVGNYVRNAAFRT